MHNVVLCTQQNSDIKFHWFYAGDYGGSGLDSFSSMIDTGSTLSASFSGDGGGGAGGGGGGGGGAG